MRKITVGWMYPNLLNLHGERGSIQALIQIGANLGLDVEILKIEDFSQQVPYENLDLLLFLPGEISYFRHLVPALRRQMEELTNYVEQGGHIVAMGTSGLLFGKAIHREDGSIQEGLGLLDLDAKERRYVWGDDLHLRIIGSKMELIGSQILMADVTTAQPLAQVLYGHGNDKNGTDGARYKNLIYTNCLGPLFVKNPWFAEEILKDICLRKFLGMSKQDSYDMASASFDTTLRFIKSKQ
jgi:CobQ-like glutamine amidotransferase family enzyme